MIKFYQYLSMLAFLLAMSLVSAAPVQNPGNNDPDTRLKLSLSTNERHLVLSEMRNFVIAIHNITNGIAKDDMPAVAGAEIGILQNLRG